MLFGTIVYQRWTNGSLISLCSFRAGGLRCLGTHCTSSLARGLQLANQTRAFVSWSRLQVTLFFPTATFFFCVLEGRRVTVPCGAVHNLLGTPASLISTLTSSPTAPVCTQDRISRTTREIHHPVMAILSCFPGLKANVRVGGELAKEYDAPPEEVEARSKTFEFHKLRSRVGEGTPYSLSYIEAKPGESFEFVIDTRSIKLERSEKPQKFQVTAVLDGFRAHPKLFSSEVFTFSKCLTGSPKTDFSETTFNFAALEICRVILAELFPVG